jgi:hypothetical protein
MKKPAKILISLVALGLALLTGVAIAPYVRIYPQEIRSYDHMITCGGGHYCNAAYERINEELRSELEGMIREVSGESNFDFHSANQHLVVVTAGTSGYGVHMVAPGNSPMWDEEVQASLKEWIDDRITMLDTEYKELLEEAEQDSSADAD